MPRKVVYVLATIAPVLAAGCSPGLVHNDCDGLDRYSVTNGATKAACKVFNIL